MAQEKLSPTNYGTALLLEKGVVVCERGKLQTSIGIFAWIKLRYQEKLRGAWQKYLPVSEYVYNACWSRSMIADMISWICSVCCRQRRFFQNCRNVCEAAFQLSAFLGKVCINVSNMDITGHLPAIRFVADYLLGARGLEPFWSLGTQSISEIWRIPENLVMSGTKFGFFLICFKQTGGQFCSITPWPK